MGYDQNRSTTDSLIRLPLSVRCNTKRGARSPLREEHACVATSCSTAFLRSSFTAPWEASLLHTEIHKGSVFQFSDGVILSPLARSSPAHFSFYAWFSVCCILLLTSTELRATWTGQHNEHPARSSGVAKTLVILHVICTLTLYYSNNNYCLLWWLVCDYWDSLVLLFLEQRPLYHKTCSNRVVFTTHCRAHLHVKATASVVSCKLFLEVSVQKVFGFVKETAGRFWGWTFIEEGLRRMSHRP